MKFIDKIAKHDKRRLFYAFEFFPPKTDQVNPPRFLMVVVNSPRGRRAGS